MATSDSNWGLSDWWNIRLGRLRLALSPETQRIVYGFLCAQRHALEWYVMAKETLESDADIADLAIKEVDAILSEVEDGQSCKANRSD